MDIAQALTFVLPTLFGTGILTWWVRGRVDEAVRIRERLRAEQRERYAQVLNPYVQAFANPNRIEEVATILQSAEYRKEVFDFTLVADDSVVKAFVALMRIADSAPQGNVPEMLQAFGRVLLELRKSVGNKKTKLNEADVLGSIGVKDIDHFLAGASTVGELHT